MSPSIVVSKIDVSVVLEISDSDARNAVSALGKVVRLSDSLDVNSVAYETDENLALPILEKIKTDAMERFRLSDVNIVQRVGKIPLGEYSHIVAVWARRVDDAFSACKFILEEMNSELPMWKYEVKGDSTEAA